MLILLAVSISAHSQNERKVVVWSGDKTCGFKSKAFTEKDFIACDSLSTDRGIVSTININGIVLAAVFADDDPYNILAVKITNKTSNIISFDSDFWGAAHYKSKVSFLADEKPIVAETSIPSRDIVRAMSSGAKLDNSLGIFIADNQYKGEVKTITRPDGARVKTLVIVPDKDAQEEAASQAETRSTKITNDQRKIRNTALTAKSVLPESSVTGLVYFRRIKKSEFTTFTISVADTMVIFLLPRKTIK